MSVELTSSDYLSFPSLPELNGTSAFTIALTLTTASVSSGWLVTKWGGGVGRNILFQVGTNVLELALQTSNGNIYQENADTILLAANTKYHIVVGWRGPKDMDFWINGVNDPGTVAINQATNTSLATVTGAAYVGYSVSNSKAAFPGDYSEIAIWNTKLPDSVAKAISSGASPDIHRRGGLFYLRATSVDRLVDEWGRTPITNSGGTTKAHPAVKDAPFVWNTPGLWGRRTYFFPTVATGGGLSIPVAMASYRQRRVA